LRPLVAVVAAVIGTVMAAPSAGAGGEFPPNVETQLDDLTQLLGQLHTPGALVAVSVPGQGRFLGIEGEAGIDNPTPLDPAMHFRIGSITKTFTATAVLQLVDQCLLGLDDTIDRWQPGVRDAHTITVRELLGHRSGIRDFDTTEEFNDVFNADPFFEWQPQQLVDLVAHRELLFPPGTAWSYSNTNYVILGLIVETLTGQPLPQVIEQRILQPLGLHDTSFPTTPDIPAPAAAPGGIVVIDENFNLVSETPFNFSPSALWAP
jgi:D-alanyl-D-alanine carboxypeptidase